MRVLSLFLVLAPLFLLKLIYLRRVDLHKLIPEVSSRLNNRVQAALALRFANEGLEFTTSQCLRTGFCVCIINIIFLFFILASLFHTLAFLIFLQ